MKREHFPVLRATHLRMNSAETFELLTERIGEWWPLSSHGLFGAEATVFFEDGLLKERSTEGEITVWAEVTAWEPPRRIVLQWHPGRDRSAASEVEFVLVPDEYGTRVELVHRGWERFGDDAETRRTGYAGESTWGSVLDCLSGYPRA